MQVGRLDASSSMTLFYDCLTYLTALTGLRIAGHVYSTDALRPLSAALQPLHNLRHLEFPGLKHKATCQLIDPMCSTIQQLTKLTCLNLKSFHVPAEDYEAFETALAHLPDLSVLKMTNDTSIIGAHFPIFYANAARKLKQVQLSAKVHLQSHATGVVASLQVRSLPRSRYHSCFLLPAGCIFIDRT